MTKQEKIREMVLNISKELNNEINYWWDFGTLLGLIRDGDIIPWDTDGDLGYIAEDKEKIKVLARRIAKKYGYEYKLFNRHRVRIFNQGPWVDFYCWKDEEREEKLINIEHDFYKPLFPYKAHIGTPILKYFYNLDFLGFVPQNYIARLENIYGYDWRIPKKEKLWK